MCVCFPSLSLSLSVYLNRELADSKVLSSAEESKKETKKEKIKPAAIYKLISYNRVLSRIFFFFFFFFFLKVGIQTCILIITLIW